MNVVAVEDAAVPPDTDQLVAIASESVRCRRYSIMLKQELPLISPPPPP